MTSAGTRIHPRSVAAILVAAIFAAGALALAGALASPADAGPGHRLAHRARRHARRCGPNAELMPTASDLAQVQVATLCLINNIRVRNGELPLRDNDSLDVAAQGHSADMASGDYFEHTTPSGETFDARILAAGYVPSGWAYELGENIECGTLSLATPHSAVKGWMRSPEHRANILNGDFRDSGIGVAPAVPTMFSSGQPGATYTQDFGALATP